jgi:ribonucleotide monophosphatase NagD (HAD superfamily)
MVGDRLYTDVAMAVDAGVDAALVLTGESTTDMVEALPAERRPRYVLPGVGHLLGAADS